MVNERKKLKVLNCTSTKTHVGSPKNSWEEDIQEVMNEKGLQNGDWEDSRL